MSTSGAINLVLNAMFKCRILTKKKCIIDFGSGTMAATDFILITGTICFLVGTFFLLNKLNIKIKEQEKQLKALETSKK